MQSKNLSQQIAANPDHSVWVSASAGTGKTKVLTDRVLRLLISGVEFEKILCLTFTNAAASEMTNRITQALMQWQTNPDSIATILGKSPTKAELKRAQSCFGKLMLSPEQLSIHTIHSFCQKTLQKFPFEAGVSPGFRVLSDIETKELCEKLIDEIADTIPHVMSSSHSLTSGNWRGYSNNEVDSRLRGNNIRGGHDNSFNYILCNTHESTFNDLILEILTNQIAFRDLFSQFSTSIEYGNFLKKESDTQYDDNFYITGFASSNHSAINILGKNFTETETALITKYNHYVALSIESKIKGFSKLQMLFCTVKGDPRKTLLHKKSREQYPDIENQLQNIQMRIFECYQKVKIARMILSTAHIFEIASYVIEKYTLYKKRLVCLDYDDLIYYTKELLTNNAVKDWVLYKLDGGVKHLLVDEAQDTSPKQWQIIESIMSEFYSGETAAKEDRTIFIVGDEKQSIYSFQGADVSNFTRLNNFIKDQMLKAQKQYKDIELDLGYRSTLPILDLVTTIFGSKYWAHTKIECFRKEAPGLVELWPLYKDETEPKNLFWPFIEEFETEQDAYHILATDIAKFIKNYINSETILPSTKKPACPEDFMILIRRRNQFTHAIIAALKEQDISVAGIDRMTIMDHLSAQDIVSIAKFVLLPEDDLNLAELLRSPIICLPDSLLYDISTMRSDSLYSSIKDKDILKLLSYFQEIGDKLGAFDFLHHIIDIMGFREVLKNANGEGSDDVLDELLNLSSSWRNKNNDNLQEFIYWIEKREIEIKRDIASSRTVRVMTIHASKGLESPVVILADTTSTPKGQGDFLWENGNFLWLGSSRNSNSIYTNCKHEIEKKDYEEYLRLLYVALTRAEDHLVIAGCQTGEKENENSWYGLSLNAMNKLESREEDGVLYYGGLSLQATTKTVNCEERSDAAISSDVKGLPGRAKVLLAMTASWSAPNEDYSNVKSPLVSRMDISYGTILHKILEDSVKTRNFTFEPSHPYIKSLASKIKESVIEKLSKLFIMPEFLTLTQYPELKTEVSIGYIEGEIYKMGRMDLVAISPIEVIIIDYKTDSKPPSCPKDINKKYIEQLKFYADSMKKIMPDHKIRAKILWLENLEFMEVVSGEASLRGRLKA